MKYISTGDAAAICSVGVNTIKRWIRQGKLSGSVTPGGRWRIPAHLFVPFLKEHDIPVPEHLQHLQPCILIIDDDPALCRLLQDAIEAAPFPAEMHAVHDGYTGLLEIGRLQPQLLVLDMLMPRINGLELIERLRLDPGPERQLRILAITGARDDRKLMRQLQQAGPDAVLFKPVELQPFVATVQRLLAADEAAHAGNR